MTFIDSLEHNLTEKDLGQISVDITRDIRRSFTFSLANLDGKFNFKEDNIIWLDTRVKLYTGLKLLNGAIEYIPQGVYILTKPQDTHTNDGKIATISAVDKAYLMTEKNGRFKFSTTIAKDTTITDAIKLIASGVGETLFNFDPSVTAKTPYELTYQPGDNRWKAIYDLAAFAKAEIYYDVFGYLRLQNVNLDEYDKYPSVWTFAPNDNFYSGNVRKLDDTQLFNHIFVVGGSNQTASCQYDLSVDETGYEVLQAVAEIDQFNNGIFTDTVAIDDSNDGEIILASYGTSFSKTDTTKTDFLVGITTNLNIVEDINGLAHLELAGYRDYWDEGLIENITRYGNQATDRLSSLKYVLSSKANEIAMSRLNGTNNIGANLTIEVNIVVPSSPASGVTKAGVVYRQTYWGNNNNTFAYFAGVDSAGNVFLGYGTNSSSGSTWTSINNVAQALEQGSTHRLKVVVNSNVHTVYIDNIEVFTSTRNSYDFAGGYGLLVVNGTGIFDSYGIFPSATIEGERTNTYNLSSVNTLGMSEISWVTDNVLFGTIEIDVAVSTNGGSSYGSWVTASNGSTIPGLSNGQSMNNVYIKVRQKITSQYAYLTPKITQISLSAKSRYKPSGTYLYNNFKITSTPITSVDNTVTINYNYIVPQNTTLSVSLRYLSQEDIEWSEWITVANGDKIHFEGSDVDLSQCLFDFFITLNTSDLTITPSLQDFSIRANTLIFKDNPYSVQRIGDILYLHNDGNPDPLIMSEYQARWRAKYELMKRLGFNQSITVSSAPLWILEAGDIITIEDSENLVTGKHLVTSFNLPLLPEMMGIDCIKYNKIIDDWSLI